MRLLDIKGVKYLPCVEHIQEIIRLSYNLFSVNTEQSDF